MPFATASRRRARAPGRSATSIPDKMWSTLNLAYLGHARCGDGEHLERSAGHLLRPAPRTRIRTVSGVAEGTIYRDDGWHFLQLGRFVERVQSVCRADGRAHRAVPDRRPRQGRRLALPALDLRGALRLPPPLLARASPNQHGRFPGRRSLAVAFDPPFAAPHRGGARRRRRRPAGCRIEAERRAGRMAARIDHDWPDRDT